MKQATYSWPAFGKILPDLVAFIVGLGTAWYLDWQTTDLVWSLWLCSLVLGYLTILSTIGAGVCVGIKALTHEDFKPTQRLPAVLIGAGVALFFLGFFSIHFCGFHAGHAAFLSHFFPINGLNDNAFSFNPFSLWKEVFKHILPIYGVFLIPTIIAERRHVFAALISAVKATRDNLQKPNIQAMLPSAKDPKKSIGDPFTRPYINVIRMHILIFFFAFSQMLKVQPFIVYTVVYCVYFFPWTAFKKE